MLLGFNLLLWTTHIDEFGYAPTAAASAGREFFPFCETWAKA